MPSVTYIQGVPLDDPYGKQITMLASNPDPRASDDDDVERMADECRRAHWTKGFMISKWISDTRGDERHPDGKDMFRGHVRRWVVVYPPNGAHPITT